MIDKTVKGIVAWVNKEVNIELSFDFLTSDDNIICRDSKRRRYAIICYGGSVSPIVRSVVREKRVHQGGFGWLVNGQAGTNAIEVVRWDEDHRYKASVEEIIEVYEDLYGESWLDSLKGGIIRLPHHINLQQILDAIRH